LAQNKLTKIFTVFHAMSLFFYKCHIENSSHFRRITMTRLPQVLAKCCQRSSVAYFNRFVFTLPLNRVSKDNQTFL